MKLNIFFAVAIAISSISVNAQTKSNSKTESVKVWGNCGMCQTRIEKAAKEAGAATAKWDHETSMLAVSYNPAKTSINKIESKVASVGHDTKSAKASDEVYEKLHGCCKYERTAGSEVAAAPCCTDKEKCTKADMKCCAVKDANHASCVNDKACCAKA